jgi:phage/plasmid-associated DNA primase
MFQFSSKEASVFKMIQENNSTTEQEDAVARFFEDCIYVQDASEECEIPSIVVYIVFHEWCKHITPNVRMTFTEFNNMFRQMVPDHKGFKDSDGIAAWLDIDMTQIAHLYFSASKLGVAFRAWQKEMDENDSNSE